MVDGLTLLMLAVYSTLELSQRRINPRSSPDPGEFSRESVAESRSLSSCLAIPTRFTVYRDYVAKIQKEEVNDRYNYDYKYTCFEWKVKNANSRGIV